MSDKALEGKTILIAGCRPKGIGLTIGMACAKQGATIIYTASRPKLYMRGLKQGKFWPENPEAEKHLGECNLLECDVTNPDHIEALFQVLPGMGIKLDGFVYSVAGGPPSILGSDLLAASGEDLLKALQVSALGFVDMMRAANEKQAWNPGSSVIALSFDCKHTYPDYGNMGAIKTYLEKWCLDYASQAPNGQRVNVMSTGPIASYSGTAIPNFDKILAFYEKEVGWNDESGRVEIAEIATTLLSPLSRESGKVFYADGGMDTHLFQRPGLLASLMA